MLLQDPFEARCKVSSSFEYSSNLEEFEPFPDSDCPQWLKGFVGMCCVVAHAFRARILVDFKESLWFYTLISCSHIDQF